MMEVEDIQASWARLGAMFAVKPAGRTPDIERLILRSAEVIPASARLCSMMISWLIRYYRLVCRHRLAVMIGRHERTASKALLGYVLSQAGSAGKVDHYNVAIKNCQALASARPLFEAYRGNLRLERIAREQSDSNALRWGLQAPSIRLYDDALRPGGWIMQENPTLRLRAIFGGSLAATVLVTLEEDSAARRNELALARACGASRASLRDALEHLELCGFITRRRRGKALEIHPGSKDIFFGEYGLANALAEGA